MILVLVEVVKNIRNVVGSNIPESLEIRVKNEDI